VGGKRANTWGLYDIQGNVFQWCRDAYQKDYYAKSTTDDPAGPPGNEYRVKRGCGYCSPAWEFRAAYRIHWGSSIRWPDVGFRVSLVLPDRVGAKTTPTTGTQATSGIQPSPFTGPDGKWKLPPGSPLPAVAPFDATKAKEYQTEWAKHLGVPVELTNSIGMKLMLIPPGEFMMGSPDSDKDAQPTERPQHRVRITKPFYMGKYPVTQQEYQQVIGSIPKQNLRGSSPRTKGEVAGRETRRFAVGNLSWEEMVEFCRRMSSLPNEKAAGRMYRLPSEAQWEYACRAGTTTRFCFGDDVSGLDEYGWPEGTWSSSSNITPPVGEKKPNAWGLYDIYANVWQFCADWFDATYYANSPVDDPPGGQLSFYVPPTVDPKGGQSGLRICRGGGWNWPKKFCRSADRNHYGTGHQEYYLGFRASLVFADNSEDQAKVTRGADAAQPADQTGN